MIEDEHGAHHGHGTGVRWLDVIMTVAIVCISVISLVVSVRHGGTMERLVEENRKMVSATTLPYLEMDFENYDPVAHKPVLGLVLTNAGVGPAIIDWVEISYKGEKMATLSDLLHACCKAGRGEPAHPLRGLYYSTPSGRILPAKESLKAYWFESGDAAEQSTFDAFAAAQDSITYRGCYCSVLDDCWLTQFDGERPKRVAMCKMPGLVPFH